jgi:hypothetical protein
LYSSFFIFSNLQDRKRKRDEEERRDKELKNKVTQERRKIDEEEKYVTNANRELYAMFNDLQGISHEYVMCEKGKKGGEWAGEDEKKVKRAKG